MKITINRQSGVAHSTRQTYKHNIQNKFDTNDYCQCLH